MKNRFASAVLLTAALLAGAAFGKTTIKDGTFEGAKTFVIENAFLRVVVCPERGGQVLDFLYKPANKRMLLKGVGVMLGNRVWNYADARLYTQWQRSPWESEVEKRPGEVRLTLRRRGDVDFTNRCRMTKQVVLRDGEAMLRVRQGFHVDSAMMRPKRIGLWFANKLAVQGERTAFLFPLDDGVARVNATASSGQSWYYNPSRGWAAAVGENGAGVCFDMEYRRLMCFYVCHSRNSTLEWAFRSAEIKDGETLWTEELIVPFAGLKTVNGSGKGVVAMFDAPAKAEPGRDARVTAKLTSAVARSAELTVSLRPLPKGGDRPVHKARIALTPGRVSSATFTVRPPTPGTWLLVGRVTSGGSALTDFLRPLTVGKEGAPVRIEPLEARLGRKTERFRDRTPLASGPVKQTPYTLKVKSPHVPWANPYCTGKLRVLVVNSKLTGRDAAELAQRLDMEVLWVTAPERASRRKPSVLRHMNACVKEYLDGPKKVDAMIVGGAQGHYFSPEIVKLMRKHVEQGMGLVYVTPNRGRDDLYALLPVPKERSLNGRNGQWRRKKEHFITAGVPFEVLPRSRFAIYRAKGDVVATIGRRSPLVAVQEGPGKGRVVVLSYGVGWQGSGGYESGITPFLEDPKAEFPYWEYYFSLLARSLVWSSRREGPVSVSSATMQFVKGHPELLLTLANTGAAVTAKAEVRLSNGYGETEARSAPSVRVAAGKTDVRLPFGEVAGGLHLADAILRDARGRVLTWGTGWIRTKAPVSVGKITFGKRGYYQGDTVSATVDLTPPDKTVRTARLSADFTDRLGRTLARWERTVSVNGPTRVKLETELGEPLATCAALTVRVSVDGKPSGVGRKEVFTFPPLWAKRQWHDYEHMLWGNVAGSYVRQYIVPLRARRFREAGLSTVITGARWLNPREYEWSAREGFRAMPMNVSFGYIAIGKRAPKGKIPLSKQRVAYQRTHDKKYLHRPICLNDPADLSQNAPRLKALADYMGWLEPIGYNLGDEMSLTDHTTPYDYDFSPKAVEAFRGWAKQRYGSLAALNAEWQTAFKTWDAVEPMTGWEVRDRRNYAPWADHREFMDITFADFFRWTRDELRKADPKATVGMSGSQSATAHSGYDWSRLTYAMDFIENYCHANTIVMQRSFNPKTHFAPWWGYRWLDPQVRWFLWRGFLNGHYGASYFVIRSFFNPDMTYSTTTAQGVPIIREFKSGVAKLLRNCKRAPTVGLHYSQPSIRGAFITGGAPLYAENRNGWILALRDAGHQSEFLSSYGLEAGELAKRTYKAFVLPYSVALSKKEAAQLRAFVERGGLLIADAKTGLMDEHCRTLSRGRLDDLFGIRRPKPDPLAPSYEGRAVFKKGAGASPLDGLAFDISVADRKLRLAGGAPLGAHGKTPVAVLKRSGKGAAIFLNFFMDGYARRQRLNLDKPLRRMTEGVLAVGDVSAPVKLTSAPPARTFQPLYTSGDTLYAATQIEKERHDAAWKTNVSLTFPRKGFIYDVRKRKLLGYGDRTKTTLLAGDAAIHAVLPYRVARVTVKPRQATAKAGARVAYDVRVGPERGRAGMHVVVVDVLGPDGKPRPHYRRKLVTRNGGADGSFPTALNDTPGRWTLRATDYVSSVRGDAPFTMSR